MTNVIQLRSRQAAGGMAHVSMLALQYAIVIYVGIQKSDERLERIRALYRSGLVIDAVELTALVPADIAALVSEFTPETYGKAAEALQLMHLGLDVVEACARVMEHQN